MNGRRSIVVMACCTLWCSTAVGQDPVPRFGDPWLMSEGAMSLPSLQGRGMGRFSITVPSLEAWAGNTAISSDALRDALIRSRYREEQINAVANSADEEFYLGFGLNLQLLSLGLNIRNKDDRPFLSLGLEHRERILFGMDIDRELVTLLYEGNKQYAGEDLLLDPLDVRSISCRELGMNAAVELKITDRYSHSIRIRPGIGLYRVIALQGLYMNDASLRMFTHTDGRAVDLRSNYDMNTAFPESGENLLNGIGSGMALDASVSLLVGDHLQVFAGMDDMGSVRFEEGVKNYRAQGAYTYRGVQYTFIDQELESTVTLDSLIALGDPDISEEGWSMPLPTQLLLGSTYGSGRTDHEPFPLFRHTWGALVAGDLSKPSFNYAPTTISVSYAYTLARAVTFGATIASYGDRAPRVGLNITLRGGPVRLGIGSTNLTPFLSRRSVSGGQAFLVLQVAW